MKTKAKMKWWLCSECCEGKYEACIVLSEKSPKRKKDDTYFMLPRYYPCSAGRKAIGVRIPKELHSPIEIEPMRLRIIKKVSRK